MSFGHSIRTCFSKYVTFSGRASRPEYWWFFLFLVLLSIAASLIDSAFFTTTATVETDSGPATVAVSGQPVQGVISAAVFLPHLAVAWRRMHDSGRSGLYALFPILTLLTALGVLVFGIGIADSFTHGGSMDILFTRLTLLVLVPTLIVLLVSPLLMLWWLTRPGDAGENRFGPAPEGASA